MTGHTTPHMKTASTRSAKTHVKAQPERNPFMSEPTAPLTRAHQLIVAAGAALEEVIAPAPASDDSYLADRVAHASRIMLALRGMRPHLDTAWTLTIPKDSWARDAPEVTATVYDWDLPRGTTVKEEARWWADLLGVKADVGKARASGSLDLTVAGFHVGVPVEMSFYLSKAEAAGLVSGEVAA